VVVLAEGPAAEEEQEDGAAAVQRLLTREPRLALVHAPEARLEPPVRPEGEGERLIRLPPPPGVDEAGVAAPPEPRVIRPDVGARRGPGAAEPAAAEQPEGVAAVELPRPRGTATIPRASAESRVSRSMRGRTRLTSRMAIAIVASP
jgi:hypothetical protein